MILLESFSNLVCRHCHSRHHTSICDRQERAPQQQNQQQYALLISNESGVVHPVVIVDVAGILCRALLDTGAGSSYASSRLLEMLNKGPVKKEKRQIDMMMSVKTT